MAFMNALSILVIAAAGALPGEEAYLAGYVALGDGKHAEAAAQFGVARDAGGPLAEFAKVRAWEAAWVSGNLEVEQTAWAWLHQGATGAARDLCAARLGLHLARTGRAEQAAGLLLPLASIDPAPWWMDAILWEAGEALARTGGAQAAAGYGFFLPIVERPGYAPQRNDASRRLKDSPDPKHRRAAAIALFRAGGFDETTAIVAATDLGLHGGMTLAAFEALLATAGAAPAGQAELAATLATNKDNAWLPLLVSRAVRANFKAGNRDGARGLALWLVETFPADRDAGDSVWFIAQALAKANDAAALDLYSTLITKAPGFWRASTAANEITQYWLRKGDLARAQSAAETLGAKFTDSKFRAETYYDLADRWFAKGDQKMGLQNLVFAANSGPGDYFAHRALGRLVEKLPDTLHGAKSKPHLKVDGVNAVLEVMPGLLAAPPALPDTVAADPRVQRARFFGLHGMDEGEWEALALLRGLPGREDDGPWYQALADAGLGHSALLWADKHKWGHDGASRLPARWRLEFPRPYLDIYQQHAKALGIDPYLLMAVSKQESTFRASIKSRSGATGVMQLMPATAKWMVSSTPGVTMEMTTHLASPINSILLGANYLSQMLDKFGGNMLYAAAAYNAGPGNVNKWLKASPAPAPDVFVNIIPFEETKGYVRKVLGNYAAYRSLYPLGPGH